MLYDKLDRLRNEKEFLRHQWKIALKNRNVEQEALMRKAYHKAQLAIDCELEFLESLKQDDYENRRAEAYEELHEDGYYRD